MERHCRTARGAVARLIGDQVELKLESNERPGFFQRLSVRLEGRQQSRGVHELGHFDDGVLPVELTILHVRECPSDRRRPERRGTLGATDLQCDNVDPSNAAFGYR